MKERMGGKRFSRKLIGSPVTPEERRLFFNDLPENQHRILENRTRNLGHSGEPPFKKTSHCKPLAPFLRKAAQYEDEAGTLLKARGLPCSRVMYLGTDTPVQYAATDAPEFVVGAAEMAAMFSWREGGVPVPSYRADSWTIENGFWTLAPDLLPTWRTTAPPLACLVCCIELDTYLENEKGYAHDSAEVLAAKIITTAFRLWNPGVDRSEKSRELACLELGEICTLMRLYSRESPEQSGRASKSRTPIRGIVTRLLEIPGNASASAKELWPHLVSEMVDEWPDAKEKTNHNGKLFVAYTDDNGKAQTFGFNRFSNLLSPIKKTIGKK
ncbi:hypothetical protein [Alcanivorax sp.]|jgi:hypothetical protein|uniref:hypothetical protein n=1 Tax=Alcanivorax sp. TaxID=1872427 RepID=UPI0032D93381